MNIKPKFTYGQSVNIKTDPKQQYMVTAIIDRGNIYYYECTNHETILTMQEVMVEPFENGGGLAGFVRNQFDKLKHKPKTNE